MKKLFPLISATLILNFLTPHSGDASDDVDRFLQTLLKDDYNVTFSAEEVEIFFNRAEPDISRYKLGILKPHKMKREKYSLDGALKEITVHDDEMQIVYSPDRKLVLKNKRLRKRSPDDEKNKLISLIRKNYNIEFIEYAAISGRKTLTYAITPVKIGSRPRFRVWLDHETGLPIKTETYDTEGNISYFNALFNLIINPSFPNKFFVIMVPPGTTAYDLTVVDGASTVYKKNRKDEKVLPGLPGGYVLKEIKTDGEGRYQLVYHDGLSNISVFREKWDHADQKLPGGIKGIPGYEVERVDLNGLEGFFCDSGQDKIMSFISGDRKFTIVGEISKAGLIDIAIELKKRGLKE